MSEPIRDAADERIRESVRDALASIEPTHTPSFERLWSDAGRGGIARTRGGRTVARPAFAIASVLIVLAGGAWLLRDATRGTGERGDDAAAEYAAARGTAPAATDDPDYLLAAQLAANFERPSPLDSLTSRMDVPLSRGLPEISEYRYPLLPEEVPL